jgi:radical SAM protein with 4Fe4S-binding SPASM domain
MQLNLVPDVFFGKAKDGNILVFSPIEGKVSHVELTVLERFNYLLKSDFMDISSEEISILKNLGLIYEGTKIELPTAKLMPFRPNSVTLFPTTRCALLCDYCYGDVTPSEIDISGKDGIDMPLSMALPTIDFIISNAVSEKIDHINLGFHGSGEPTYRWDFLTKSVEYAQKNARKNHLEIKTFIGTNGVLSDKKIEWIVNNIYNTALSWDGPEDIQNSQRRLRKQANKSSYDYVSHTALRFIENNYNFGVRATITEQTVGRLDEIFDFFVDFGVKIIHLEPLSECGRCMTTKIKSPSPQEFVENYLPLIDKAKRCGVTLYNSFAPVDHIKRSFCGANGSNFFVTSQGYVTSCLEVALVSDTRSDIFFYGKFNEETQKFEIDDNKRKFLLNRETSNMYQCNNCYAKWQCGGECMAKIASIGDVYRFDPNQNLGCLMQQKMLHSKLDLLMKGE